LPAAAAASAPRAPFDEAAWARDNLSTEGRRMLHLRRADGLSEEHIARLLQLAPGFVAESLRGIEERIAQARKEA
jgi:hypothetical protein